MNNLIREEDEIYPENQKITVIINNGKEIPRIRITTTVLRSDIKDAELVLKCDNIQAFHTFLALIRHELHDESDDRCKKPTYITDNPKDIKYLAIKWGKLEVTFIRRTSQEIRERNEANTEDELDKIRLKTKMKVPQQSNKVQITLIRVPEIRLLPGYKYIRIEDSKKQ